MRVNVVNSGKAAGEGGRFNVDNVHPWALGRLFLLNYSRFTVGGHFSPHDLFSD